MYKRQVRKEAVAGGTGFTVGGMAKGAAMLAPAMATMLAVLTTDTTSEGLHATLERVVERSFNQLVVDGCTSTNDTVILLAGGAVADTPVGQLERALAEASVSLVSQMAKDAEGATKFVRVLVRGARSSADARVAVRAVANSQLVQCSLNGGDPYWGRVLSELGASGAVIDPERVEIAYGDSPLNHVVVCRDGIAAEHDATELERVMAQRDIHITCDLELGQSEAMVFTTDLSHAYIDENRGTS